jgi:hypothetical protein
MNQNLVERQQLVDRMKLLAMNVCSNKTGGADFMKSVGEFISWVDAFEESCLTVAMSATKALKDTQAENARLLTDMAAVRKAGNRVEEAEAEKKDEEAATATVPVTTTMEKEEVVVAEAEDLDASQWFSNM